MRDRTQLLGNRAGHRCLLGAGMLRRGRLDQRNPRLFHGGSVMAHPMRHDEKFARPYRHSSTIGLGPANAQYSTQDQEHLVLLLMAVPGKLAMNPDHFDELVIDLPYDSRRP